jgi:hypothetical protein
VLAHKKRVSQDKHHITPGSRRSEYGSPLSQLMIETIDDVFGLAETIVIGNGDVEFVPFQTVFVICKA